MKLINAFCMSLILPPLMAFGAVAIPALDQDPADIHNMQMFLPSSPTSPHKIFLYHLPMSMPQHAYQVVLEVSFESIPTNGQAPKPLNEQLIAAGLADKTNTTAYFMMIPTDYFTIPQLLSPQTAGTLDGPEASGNPTPPPAPPQAGTKLDKVTRFKAGIIHYDSTPNLSSAFPSLTGFENVTVKVEKVLYYHQFPWQGTVAATPAAAASGTSTASAPATYILFGQGADLYGIHAIDHCGTYDHVLALQSTAPASISVNGPSVQTVQIANEEDLKNAISKKTSASATTSHSHAKMELNGITDYFGADGSSLACVTPTSPDMN